MPTITINEIRAAHELVHGRVHTTPLYSCKQLSHKAGVELFFKCENFQKTGSFKVRGVLNKIHYLDDKARAKGLVSISAGNHAQAMAWAASTYGTRCTIAMPLSAAKTKIHATEEYGATVVQPGDVFAAFAEATRLANEEGMTMVHPFEDEHIIAGHGTVGFELLQQLEDVDAVVVGIGGGALCSGIAVAVKEQFPNIKVYGVEPEGANAMQVSFNCGEPSKLENVGSIADGLAPPMAGIVPFGIIQRYVEDVVTVSEQEIISAMLDLMSRAKLVVEPSGAAATAAVLSEKIKFKPRARVVCILSGGNVDIDKISEMAASLRSEK